jgi:hypothetical protein
MCWADRLALLWALLVLAILTLMWAAPHQSILDMPAAGWGDFAKTVLVPWGFLRAADLISGGPMRRRRRQS